MAAKKIPLKRSSKKREKKREVIKQLRSGEVPGNINRVFMLRQLKYVFTKVEADRIIEKLNDEDFDYITAFPLPNSYEELMKDLGPYQKDLKRELDWVLRFLYDYNEELEAFVKLEIEYQKSFLIGNYEAAKSILDEVEKSISYSAWGLQQRLLIAELEKGFPGNKDMLSNLLSDKLSPIAVFLANYTSIRVEKNISVTQYDEFIDNYTDSLQEEIIPYAYFKVDFFRTFSYPEPEIILHLDGRSSIIDRYITFKQLLKISLCNWRSNDHPNIEVWKRAALNISQKISDPELKLMCNVLGEYHQVSKNDMPFLKILDDYTDSKYQEVIENAEALISSDPRSYHTILTYVKALLNLKQKQKTFGNGGALVDQVIQSLMVMLNKNEGFSDEIYSNVFKISHQLGNHPLAIGIYMQLNEEVPYRLDAFQEIDFYKFFMLSSCFNNPGIHQYIEKPRQQAFFQGILGGASSSTVDLIKKLDRNETFNPNDLNIRELKYYSIVLRNSGRYEEALKVYEIIFSKPEFLELKHASHTVLDVLVGKFSCLIEANKIPEALDVAVNSILENENFTERFFSPVLLKLLMETDEQSLLANICVPLYLAFFKGNIEAYNLYVAYDNYLAILGYETPSELILNYDSYDERDLSFLRIVCTHEVLHSSPYFENQEELDLERLEVCNFLLDKVSDYEGIEAEISDLLRKILVRKGIKQINFSKIYVDVAGVTDALQKELRENFIRNVEIASLPIDQLNRIVDSVGNMVVFYIDNPEEGKELTEKDLDKVKITSYNRFLHFSEAFLKVRDKFIFDKDHGLFGQLD